MLLALVALQSVGFALSSPARGAIVPRILPVALVPAANTLTFTVSMIGGVVGPLLAGLVISQAGFAWAYALDAALFTVGLYAALRLPPVPPLGEPSRPGLRSVVEGLSLHRHETGAADVVRGRHRGHGARDAQGPVPAGRGEPFRRSGVGGLAVRGDRDGIGGGGLASGWIGRVRRQGLALVVAVVVWGVAVAAAGLAGSLWLAVLLLAVGGAADLVSAVYRQTILQTYAPDAMRGRLQGVFIVVVAGGPRLGDLRAGGTADLVGDTASWVGGGVAAAVLAVLLAVAVPSLVRYRADARA